jgi:hypothetical protein
MAKREHLEGCQFRHVGIMAIHNLTTVCTKAHRWTASLTPHILFGYLLPAHSVAWREEPMAFHLRIQRGKGKGKVVPVLN